MFTKIASRIVSNVKSLFTSTTPAVQDHVADSNVSFLPATTPASRCVRNFAATTSPLPTMIPALGLAAGLAFVSPPVSLALGLFSTCDFAAWAFRKALCKWCSWRYDLVLSNDGAIGRIKNFCSRAMDFMPVSRSILREMELRYEDKIATLKAQIQHAQEKQNGDEERHQWEIAKIETKHTARLTLGDIQSRNAESRHRRKVKQMNAQLRDAAKQHRTSPSTKNLEEKHADEIKVVEARAQSKVDEINSHHATEIASIKDTNRCATEQLNVSHTNILTFVEARKDAEIEEVKTENRQATELLQSAHTDELNLMVDRKDSEIKDLKAQHGKKLVLKEDQKEAEIADLKSQHAAELARQDANTAQLQKNHEKELKRRDSDRTIANIQHQRETDRLKSAHKRDMDQQVFKSTLESARQQRQIEAQRQTITASEARIKDLETTMTAERAGNAETIDVEVNAARKKTAANFRFSHSVKEKQWKRDQAAAIKAREEELEAKHQKALAKAVAEAERRMEAKYLSEQETARKGEDRRVKHVERQLERAQKDKENLAKELAKAEDKPRTQENSERAVEQKVAGAGQAVVAEGVVEALQAKVEEFQVVVDSKVPAADVEALLQRVKQLEAELKARPKGDETCKPAANHQNEEVPMTVNFGTTSPGKQRASRKATRDPTRPREDALAVRRSMRPEEKRRSLKLTASKFAEGRPKPRTGAGGSPVTPKTRSSSDNHSSSPPQKDVPGELTTRPLPSSSPQQHFAPEAESAQAPAIAVSQESLREAHGSAAPASGAVTASEVVGQTVAKSTSGLEGTGSTANTHAQPATVEAGAGTVEGGPTEEVVALPSSSVACDPEDSPPDASTSAWEEGWRETSTADETMEVAVDPPADEDAEPESPMTDGDDGGLASMISSLTLDDGAVPESDNIMDTGDINLCPTNDFEMTGDEFPAADYQMEEPLSFGQATQPVDTDMAFDPPAVDNQSLLPAQVPDMNVNVQSDPALQRFFKAAEVDLQEYNTPGQNLTTNFDGAVVQAGNQEGGDDWELDIDWDQVNRAVQEAGLAPVPEHVDGTIDPALLSPAANQQQQWQVPAELPNTDSGFDFAAAVRALSSHNQSVGVNSNFGSGGAGNVLPAGTGSRFDSADLFNPQTLGQYNSFMENLAAQGPQADGPVTSTALPTSGTAPGDGVTHLPAQSALDPGSQEQDPEVAVLAEALTRAMESPDPPPPAQTTATAAAPHRTPLRDILGPHMPPVVPSPSSLLPHGVVDQPDPADIAARPRHTPRARRRAHGPVDAGQPDQWPGRPRQPLRRRLGHAAVLLAAEANESAGAQNPATPTPSLAETPTSQIVANLVRGGFAGPSTQTAPQFPGGFSMPLPSIPDPNAPRPIRVASPIRPSFSQTSFSTAPYSLPGLGNSQHAPPEEGAAFENPAFFAPIPEQPSYHVPVGQAEVNIRTREEPDASEESDADADADADFEDALPPSFYNKDSLTNPFLTPSRRNDGGGSSTPTPGSLPGVQAQTIPSSSPLYDPLRSSSSSGPFNRNSSWKGKGKEPIQPATDIKPFADVSTEEQNVDIRAMGLDPEDIFGPPSREGEAGPSSAFEFHPAAADANNGTTEPEDDPEDMNGDDTANATADRSAQPPANPTTHNNNDDGDIDAMSDIDDFYGDDNAGDGNDDAIKGNDDGQASDSDSDFSDFEVTDEMKAQWAAQEAELLAEHRRYVDKNGACGAECPMCAKA